MTGIPVHFATIAKLLQEDRLALASKDQGQLALTVLCDAFELDKPEEKRANQN